MRTHLLRCEQLLPLDIETTFSFFADAANLERLTPPWLNFQILSQLPIEMRPGALIDYRLRLRGVPIRWQSEIKMWEPPFRFMDRQLHGPYRLWEHTHTFEAVSPGATLVTDEVVYAVPGGAIIDAVAVRPDLGRIFRFRRAQMEAWAIEVLRGDAVTDLSEASVPA